MQRNRYYHFILLVGCITTLCASDEEKYSPRVTKNRFNSDGSYTEQCYRVYTAHPQACNLNTAINLKKDCMVDNVIKNGASVDACFCGETPLCCAARTLNPIIVQKLLEHGAQADGLPYCCQSVPSTNTALHCEINSAASATKQEEKESILPIVQKLVDHGANVLRISINGKIPLEVVAENEFMSNDIAFPLIETLLVAMKKGCESCGDDYEKNILDAAYSSLKKAREFYIQNSKLNVMFSERAAFMHTLLSQKKE